MASPPAFSLSEIGDELDRARSARNGQDRPRRASELEVVSEDEMVDHTTRAPAMTSSTTSAQTDDSDQGGAVCLCCLTRPPSAVLLPCCHLNLCYLCAPLLLIKGQRPSPPPVLVDPGPTISTSPTRVSYYDALKQATANHPKSRRMSMGHCEPPDRGTRGAEMRGQDLMGLAVSVRENGGESVDESGLKAGRDDDGRVNLHCEDNGTAARCLVCRSAVTGWLRVYS